MVGWGIRLVIAHRFLGHRLITQKLYTVHPHRPNWSLRSVIHGWDSVYQTLEGSTFGNFLRTHQNADQNINYLNTVILDGKVNAHSFPPSFFLRIFWLPDFQPLSYWDGSPGWSSKQQEPIGNGQESARTVAILQQHRHLDLKFTAKMSAIAINVKHLH